MDLNLPNEVIPTVLAAAVTSLPYLTTERQIVTAEQLTGGLQNINFKVATTDGTLVVVRIPSTDAQDHGQTAAVVHSSTHAAGSCGVGPEVCAFVSSSGVLVTRFLDGRVLSSADFVSRDDDGRLLSSVVATIKRLHDECTGMVSSQASDVLRGYDLDPIPPELRPRVELLRNLLQRTLGAWDEVVCCHNDLDPSNIIHNKESARVYLVDWEWSGPGDRVCDLATFCDLCNFDDETERRALSEYYGQEILLASTGLYEARLKLWRVWFVVRGSLWAAVKAASSSQNKEEEKDGIKEGEEPPPPPLPCDFVEYAAMGWKTLAERMDMTAVMEAMQRVREGLSLVGR